MTTGVGFNWVDGIVLVLVLAGAWLGHRRGFSEGLLPLVKWAMILGIGAAVYHPLGQLLSRVSGMGLAWSRVCVYLGVLVLLLWLFARLRDRVGERLLAADLFGKADGFLGMVAGGLQYGMAVIAFVATIHAFDLTARWQQLEDQLEEESAERLFWEIAGSLDRECLYTSLLGPWLRQHLPQLLIQPEVVAAPPDRETPINQRNREIDRALAPR